MNPIKTCIEAALNGAKAAKSVRGGTARIKTGSGAHRSMEIVSDADFASQLQILKVLKRRDPNVLFMTEELVKNPEFQKNYLKNVSDLAEKRVYIIDELDGSASRNANLYEWSVSVAYVEKMRHIAGAVFAPQVFGGALFSTQLGKGAWLQLGKNKAEKIQVGNRDLRGGYVLFGPDNLLPKYPAHNRLVLKIADQARKTNSHDSCAFALGLVATGRADALIQPLQSPWDWAAGKLLVEEAGGGVLFYEMKGGKIIPVQKLKPEHYNPDERAVGFVAGNKIIARSVMRQLLAL